MDWRGHHIVWGRNSFSEAAQQGGGWQQFLGSGIADDDNDDDEPLKPPTYEPLGVDVAQKQLSNLALR